MVCPEFPWARNCCQLANTSPWKNGYTIPLETHMTHESSSAGYLCSVMFFQTSTFTLQDKFQFLH